MISPNSLGNTSRPRVKKTAIWLTQASASWKSATVRRAGSCTLPSTRPVRYTARKPEPCRTSAAPNEMPAAAIEATG